MYMFDYFIYGHHLLLLCFIFYYVGGDNVWEWLQKILFPKGKKNKKDKKDKKGSDK